MCGLVFVGGRSALSLGDVQLFSQMLQCDTYRGDHSTGVAAWFKPYGKEGFAKLAKAAVDGFDFVNTELYVGAVTHKEPGFSANSFIQNYPKAIFGHNRYATMGAINAANAHPFQHGHIILAHNGTLRNRTNLPNYQDFAVDSENIAYSMSVLGAEETIKRLQGAFTLIWLDEREMTMNIIRNTERPFHLFETGVGDWFGCSEEKMGEWLIGRSKGRSIKRHFECKPGVQYIFDVSTGCVLREEVERELMRFQSSYQGGTQSGTSSYLGRSGYYDRYGIDDGDDDDYWWNNRGNQSASSMARSQTGQEARAAQAEARGATQQEVKSFPANVQRYCEDAGLEGMGINSRIEFSMYDCYEYPKKAGYGRITGHILNLPEFVEVQVHDVKILDYTEDALGIVQIMSAYVQNHILTIIAKPQPDGTFFQTLIEPEKVVEPQTEDDEEEEDNDEALMSWLDQVHERDMHEEVRQTLTGEKFTAREWGRSHHNVCAMCSNPMNFDDMEFARIENSYCFCGDCVEATEMRAENIKKERELAEAAKAEREAAKAADEEARRIALRRAPIMLEMTYGDEIYCHVCNGYHPPRVILGDMTHAEWTTLSTVCKYKLEYRDKFMGTGSRPVLSIVNKAKPKCSACNAVEVEKKEDLCANCTARFHEATNASASHQGESSVLLQVGSKPMWITKENWEKMNGCRQCGRRIPFGIADLVEFWGSAPVCPDCSDDLDRKGV